MEGGGKVFRAAPKRMKQTSPTASADDEGRQTQHRSQRPAFGRSPRTERGLAGARLPLEQELVQDRRFLLVPRLGSCSTWDRCCLIRACRSAPPFSSPEGGAVRRYPAVP
uniref:Uncharacterized protein n=1 Tax=Micrurus corallinus TaxID=54390 RepID=A0A2D4EV92_MICCO